MTSPNVASFTRTLRLKVRAESYSWLNAAAIEVNQVWNWANATSIDAADRNRRANAKPEPAAELPMANCDYCGSHFRQAPGVVLCSEFLSWEKILGPRTVKTKPWRELP